MRKIRDIVRAGGGVLLAIAAVAAGLYYTPWAHDHPQTVEVVLVCSLVGAVIAGLLWMLTSDGAEHNAAKVGIQVNSAGRDNNGMQMFALRDAHIYGDSALQKLMPQPVSAPESLPIENSQNIQFEVTWHWMEIVYDIVPGRWKQSTQFDYANNPRQSFIVSFSRPVPGIGKRADKELSLVAILKFTHSHGENRVPRAYWLGLTQNEVVFCVGHQEDVIVGCLEEPYFASYANRYQHDGLNEYFSVPLRELGERTIIPAKGSISIEVSLFDAYAGRTIEQKRYEMTFKQGSRYPSIVEKA
jgi:hypothetical protein